MSSTSNSNRLTPDDEREGELLIRSIQDAIEGSHRAVAAWALVSVLGTLIVACARDPEGQARRLGKRFVETVQGPPESEKIN